MAADLAAPVRDVETSTPFDPDEPDCKGALDGLRWLPPPVATVTPLPPFPLNEPIDALDLKLERDDGRAECTVKS